MCRSSTTARMAPMAEPAPAPMAQDIRIEPVQPRPVMAAPAPEPIAHAEPSLHFDDSFIPPMPERAVVRPTRMPRVEDLPAPGQAQLNAQRGAQPAPVPPNAIEQKRMSLMQRLASVGFGRKEDEAEHAPAPAAGPPGSAGPDAAGGCAERRPCRVYAPSGTAPASRPAQGQLDPHGRARTDSQQRGRSPGDSRFPASPGELNDRAFHGVVTDPVAASRGGTFAC